MRWCNILSRFPTCLFVYEVVCQLPGPDVLIISLQGLLRETSLESESIRLHIIASAFRHVFPYPLQVVVHVCAHLLHSVEFNTPNRIIGDVCNCYELINNNKIRGLQLTCESHNRQDCNYQTITRRVCGTITLRIS